MKQRTKGYLGVDIGSISTKGVVIDAQNKVLAQSYLWTEGNPIQASKQVLAEILAQLKGRPVEVVAVGTTGSARELIGAILEATIVKNEITAHAVGTLAFHPEVRTIFEIGGQDSKIIILDHGIVVDYAMNTLCAAGTGAFLSAQARRLSIPVEEFGQRALRSQNPTKIAGRCTVFAESDLVHKAQAGYPINDIIAGLCHSIVYNYLNNVGKGKTIQPPIVFQGGVSKNVGVVRSFEQITNHPMFVDDLGHLMGAIGTAILARNTGQETKFDFTIKDTDFKTVGLECGGCPNNCEVICVLRDDQFLDAWGNRCPIGLERARAKIEQLQTGQTLTDHYYTIELKEKRQIAVGVMAYRFSKPKDYSYCAGQYVDMILPELKHQPPREYCRTMSLASAPHETDLLIVMRQSDSLFKRSLKGLPIGSTIEITQPMGKLVLNDHVVRPVVLIAGGIGITPFIGIVREESRCGWPRAIHLFYSGRTPAESAFLEELETLSHESQGRFTFVPTMTRLSRHDSWPYPERTRITSAMLRRYLADPLAPDYYLVGLPEMVTDIRNLLDELMIPPDQIKSEQFSGYQAGSSADLSQTNATEPVELATTLH